MGKRLFLVLKEKGRENGGKKTRGRKKTWDACWQKSSKEELSFSSENDDFSLSF